MTFQETEGLMIQTAHADEDRWAVPAEWWTEALPFRGLGPVRAPGVTEDAAAQWVALLAENTESIRRLLSHNTFQSDAELAHAAMTILDQPDGHTPLGVAAVALASWAMSEDWRWDEWNTRIADGWIARYGAGFAAETAVRFAGLGYSYSGQRHRLPMRLPSDSNGDRGAYQVLARVRAHLAVLSDAEYRGVIARLSEVRASGPRSARIAATYLIPTQQDWLDSELAADEPVDSRGPFPLLMTCATDIAQLDLLTERLNESPFSPNPHSYDAGRSRALRSALAHIGPDCAALVGRALNQKDLPKDYVEVLAEVLAQLPTDQAFELLLRHLDRPGAADAVFAAVQRFPRRAMRLLAASARSSSTRYLLRTHATTHPELAVEFGAASEHQPTCTEDQLPELLRNPPWERSYESPRPVVLTAIAQPRPIGLDWAPGEQDEWAAIRVAVPAYFGTDWADRIADAVEQRQWSVVPIFAAAPPDLVRKYLPTAKPAHLWDAEDGMRRILARFGTEALDWVLASARENRPTLTAVIPPITGTEITRLMTKWLGGKLTSVTARAWFDRHIGTAATDLIGDALATPGRDRTAAESALRILTGRGHRAAILAAANALGAEVGAAITAIIDTDPLMLLPKKIPAAPSWLVPAALPPILLRDNGLALSDAAVTNLCTMLAMPGPSGDYAGVEQVAAIAEPASLAAFTLELFEAWKLAGYPPKQAWVLRALGLFGDDETVRRLGALIRLWPGESAHARAVSALDVLTAIGSDAALTQLAGIADKVKFKGLKTKAREKVAEVAAELGLTPDELADRLVPTFGLDANGTMVLDYGPRGFVIGFDEHLAPTVFDAARDDGGQWRATTRRKSLPKPGVKDDPELSMAAYKAFGALKKEVRTGAADQIRRFERAMVTGRRWTADTQQRLFVEHPLLWHLSRRLVWATFDETGTVTGSFRIAEDRTRADAHDDAVILADDVLVGIAHPLHLADTLGAWGEVFADYEILQPFPQLQREAHALTEEERAGVFLPRFHRHTLPTGKVLGLTKYGWERDTPQDAGIQGAMLRTVGTDLTVIVELDPGIAAGYAMEFDEQKITEVKLVSGAYTRWQPTAAEHTFGELDAIVASELLRELEILTNGR
ncbi:DUF4132 domain-containing protein [Nocardia sp. NPDC051990]|uniref:DUF4132 domain-containing protein n=1 Tax=Nocardia sp. NPDC051990 TaxID=3155285 RepID=UPI003432C9CE